PHVAATAPALVAHAPEPDVPRRLPAVVPPPLRHRAGAVAVPLFPPLRHLLRRPAPHIAHDERRGAEPIHQLQVLVRPEAVVFGDVAPHGVHDRGTPLGCADPVLPVVAIGETAARPAEVG